MYKYIRTFDKFNILFSHAGVKTFCMLILGLGGYVLFINIPPPVALTKQFAIFHIGLAIFLITLFGVLFSRSGFFWETCSFTLAMVLFAIPLVYKWQTGQYEGQLLGGLLPLSDAQSYYGDAQQLLTGNHVTPISTHRPFFSVYLAVLLVITGNNLQATLAIIVALTAISIYLAAREIGLSSFAASGALYLIICYWYYFPFAGSLMTESLGLSLGSLALAFFLKGIRNSGTFKYYGFGLFILTLALNSRAGAFIILPTLCIWLALSSPINGKPWFSLTISVIIVISGMIINLVLTKLIGSPKGAAFSNYSYTLYGLVSGYEGWVKAVDKFPGRSEVEIYEIAFEKFMDQPDLLLTGITRSFKDYFTPVNGAFSFMRLVYDRRNIADRILWVFFLLGLISALINFKSPNNRFMLTAISGIFLSVALVPPSDSDSMRAYAATMPISIFVVSIGMAFIVAFIGIFFTIPTMSKPLDLASNLILPTSISFVAILFIGSIFIVLINNSLDNKFRFECPPGSEELYFYMGRQSSIVLMEDKDLEESYMPYLRITDFKSGVLTGSIFSFYPNLDEELLSLQAGQIINLVTYFDPGVNNFDQTRGAYLITTGEVLPPGFHRICGYPPKIHKVENQWYYSDNVLGPQADRTYLPSLSRDSVFDGLIRTLYAIGFITIVVLLLINLSILQLISSKQIIFFVINIIVIFCGIFVYLHSNAIFPLATQRLNLDISNIAHIEGFAFKIPLGVNWMNQKSIRNPPIIVYENGVPLKRPNEKIYSLKHIGKGRFFVQDSYLYFSSSDSTDPRINGNSYEIEWPTPIRQRYQIAIYFISLLGLFTYIFHFAGGQINIKRHDPFLGIDDQARY